MSTNRFHLIGKYGDIKSINGTTSQAIITDPNTISRYMGESPRTGKSAKVNFDNSELDKWIKRLEIQFSDDGMIRLSPEFFE